MYHLQYQEVCMASRGRPGRGIPTIPVLLRIPAPLYEQLERHYQGVLSRPLSTGEWHRPSRNDAILTLLAAALQPPPPARPPAAPAQPPQRKAALPPQTLEAIADERTHCEGLSLREFSQRLFDKDIYRATSRTDGTAQPAEAGWLKRQLDKAREAGLL
jgi:hypothetical protein